MLLLRIVNAVERVLKLSMLFVQMGYLQSSFCANFVGLGRKCLQDHIWCAMLIYNQYYIVTYVDCCMIIDLCFRYDRFVQGMTSVQLLILYTRMR